jgi:GntR family transcriptional repressor for pyruvate dehydrogenase complex
MGRNPGTGSDATRVDLAYHSIKAGIVGHGYFVARVTLQSINETFSVRRLLEGSAAARAAELATPSEIEQLRTLAVLPIPALPGTQQCTRREAPAVYHDAEIANLRFHLAIAAAARNHLLLELIERCLEQVDRFMSLGVHFGPFHHGATDAHLAVVDAIARHDAAAAQASMEQHLDRGAELMTEALMRGQLTVAGVQ